MCQVFDGCTLRGLWEHHRGAPDIAMGIRDEMGEASREAFPEETFLSRVMND